VGLGLTALVEHGARRRLTTTELALVLLGVIAVCLTIGFNASYDPYSADLASPASIDLLALVFLLATFYFLLANDTGWCIAAATLQALSRPSALLLCGMFLAALLVVERNPRSPRLRLTTIATATTLVVSIVYVFAIESMTGTQVSEGSGNLLLRMRFLRFDDWLRLAWLLVPAGVVPALLMTRWRESDIAARAFTLVTLMYFAFFYALAFVSLHHFAPAMLLPLAVFWRQQLHRDHPWPKALRVGTVLGLAIAVLAAMPRSLAPYRATRVVGRTIAFDVGPERGYAMIRNTFDASRVLDSLLAPYWRVRDAQVERLGDPMSLAWYAAKLPPAPDSARYVVQRESVPPPAGFVPLGTARGFAIYAKDIQQWTLLRSTPPPPDGRSPLYDVPRTTLFQHLGRDAGIVQVDLRAVACGVLPQLPPCASSAGS
jgi:hypothetical protein